MNESWLEKLADPVDKSPLRRLGNTLVSTSGRTYPVVEGIPILLVPDAVQTTRTALDTLKAAQSPDNADRLYLHTTGIRGRYLEDCRRAYQSAGFESSVDPAVTYLVMRGGYMYHHLIGHIDDYPIPEIRLPSARNASPPPTLLDIGANWGRWSIAAAIKGYRVVALDPSLGALMAGRRAAKQLGVSIEWIVGDARFLPFREQAFNQVFSYSVLQHLSEGDLKLALTEIRRVLSPAGASLIQMANGVALRSLYHLVRRRFREPKGMDVRYYTVCRLRQLFGAKIGPSALSVDGFFGLGIQESDLRLMTPRKRIIIRASWALRTASQHLPFLTNFADSVYVSSRKP